MHSMARSLKTAERLYVEGAEKNLLMIQCSGSFYWDLLTSNRMTPMACSWMQMERIISIINVSGTPSWW